MPCWTPMRPVRCRGVDTAKKTLLSSSLIELAQRHLEGEYAKRLPEFRN